MHNAYNRFQLVAAYYYALSRKFKVKICLKSLYNHKQQEAK